MIDSNKSKNMFFGGQWLTMSVIMITLSAFLMLGSTGSADPENIVNVPDFSVDVVFSHWGTESYWDATINGVGGPEERYNVWDDTWVGWCVDEYHYIYPGTHYDVTMYSSYDPGMPWPDSNWDMVNYVINHKHPDATKQDIQDAIWCFINGEKGYPSDPEAQAMVDEAVAYGEGFVPQPVPLEGQKCAVLCDAGDNVQGTFIEVLVSPDIVYVDDGFDDTTPGWGYDHFDNIMDGVIAVADCGTIYVEDGDYYEDVNVYAQGVTVQAVNPPTNTAIIYGTVDITADGVTFENFKVMPTVTYTADEAAIAVYASDVVVNNNIVDGITGDGSGYFTIKGIHVYSSSGISNIDLTNNIIQNVENQGTSTPPYGGADGIMVQGVIDGVNVIGNTVEDIHSAGWAYGIEVTPTASAPSNPPQNIVILENDVLSVNDGSVYNVWTDPMLAPYPGVGFSLDETVPGAGDGNASEVTVNYNNFVNTPFGAVNKDTSNILDAECNWWDSVNGPIHPSNIYNMGLQGDIVSDYIDYCPWLDDMYPDGDCVGGICADYIWVDDDAAPGWYDWDHVNSIQTAVNRLCNCGTIYVADGTYIEQILINKSLDLLGDPGATIQAPAILQAYTIQETGPQIWYPIIFAYGGTKTGTSPPDISGPGQISVNIDGFEIDGDNNAYDAPDRTVAILYRNIAPGCTDAIVSNNVIHSMYDADGEGNGPQTFGVLVYGNSYVNIENNDVSEFSRGGISSNGDDGMLTDPFVNIISNTVTGNGYEPATNWWAENGIQIGFGAGGTIVDNNVSDCQVNNPNWVSTGILVYDALNGVEILDNDVTLCDTGISITSPSYDLIDGNHVSYCNSDALRLGWPTDNATVTNNVFSYSMWGIGIWDASDNLIDGNIIYENDYGIEINGNCHRNTIVNNYILENPVGILVTEYCGYEPTETIAHYNYIDTLCHLDIGIWNQVSDIVDADLNWWGAPDGPSGMINDANTGRIADGFGEQVIGLVNFDPWWGIEASGTATPTSALTGQSIFFDASDSFAYDITGDITGDLVYLWDLDNGHYSQYQAFGYVYSTPGTYNVKLRIRHIDYAFEGISDPEFNVYDYGFFYDWAYFTVTVSDPSMPLVANANAGNFGDYEGRVNEPIQFFGAATGGTPPYSFSWDFDDGSYSEVMNPTHIFENEGTYTVTLTVTDNEGNTDSDTAQVIVHGADNLIADAGGPYTGITYEAITFHGSANGGIEPYTFVWDFGDGTPPIQAQNPTYSYSELGTYTIKLTVTDNQGTIDDHYTTATILTEGGTVEIRDIKGGFGLKATIQAGMYPVDWTINLDGEYIFYSGSASGTIEAWGVQTVRLPFSFGLGKVDITITADTIIEQRSALMIGPFIIAIK